MKVYYWIHHTGRFDGNTGVQRVVRNLALSLVEAGHDLSPVRWCHEREAIVHAERPWLKGLSEFGGPRIPPGPDPGVPLHVAAERPEHPDGTWLIVPEVPHIASDAVPSLAVVLDYARFHRLRSALVFYDIIPLRQPGYEAMASEHEAYTRALVAADLVLPISAFSHGDLGKWWGEEGYEEKRLPTVITVALPHEVSHVSRVTTPSEPPGPQIRFAALGSVEPRKNQVRTARAFARLCARRPDLQLRLDLVGGLHPAVADEIREVAMGEPRIRVRGYLHDDEVQDILAASHATVFTSLYEGFGLPVAESLWLGKPCLCSDSGAVAEIAAGGGCLEVPPEDEHAIEAGFERLAEDLGLRAELTLSACTRPLRTWRDYAADVSEALETAPPLRHLVVIEGSRGISPMDHPTPSGVSCRPLKWHADTEALVPATDGSHGFGAGLRGTWALLPYERCEGPPEALRIMACAQDLGLMVALTCAGRCPPELLPSTDLALFSDVKTCESVLAAALHDLPRDRWHSLEVSCRHVGLRVVGSHCQRGSADLLRWSATAPRAPLLLDRRHLESGVQHRYPTSRPPARTGAAASRSGARSDPLGRGGQAGRSRVGGRPRKPRALERAKRYITARDARLARGRMAPRSRDRRLLRPR